MTPEKLIKELERDLKRSDPEYARRQVGNYKGIHRGHLVGAILLMLIFFTIVVFSQSNSKQPTRKQSKPLIYHKWH